LKYSLMYVYMCACVYISMCVCVIHAYIDGRVNTYAWYTYMHTYIHIYMDIKIPILRGSNLTAGDFRTNIHTYIHTCMDMHIPMLSRLQLDCSAICFLHVANKAFGRYTNWPLWAVTKIYDGYRTVELAKCVCVRCMHTCIFIVRVCVSVYLRCVYLCGPDELCARVWWFVRVYLHGNTHTHIHTYTYIHTHYVSSQNCVAVVCVYTCTHKCIHIWHAYTMFYIHTYIHTYIHACIHDTLTQCSTYIHTYMHTYIHKHILTALRCLCFSTAAENDIVAPAPAPAESFNWTAGSVSGAHVNVMLSKYVCICSMSVQFFFNSVGELPHVLIYERRWTCKHVGRRPEKAVCEQAHRAFVSENRQRRLEEKKKIHPDIEYFLNCEKNFKVWELQAARGWRTTCLAWLMSAVISWPAGPILSGWFLLMRSLYRAETSSSEGK
jgi:hypothetical protein